MCFATVHCLFGCFSRKTQNYDRQNKTAMGSRKTQNDDTQQNNEQSQDTQRRQTCLFGCFVVCLATVYYFFVCHCSESCDCSLFFCLSPFFVLRLSNFFSLFIIVTNWTVARHRIMTDKIKQQWAVARHRTMTLNKTMNSRKTHNGDRQHNNKQSHCFVCLSSFCVSRLFIDLFCLSSLCVLRMFITLFVCHRYVFCDCSQNNEQSQDTQRRQTT
jgi:hypothetical protein